MKSVGLITEYNPFHNGHLFHATLSKQRSETNVTIAIMSGNFVTFAFFSTRHNPILILL